MLYLLHATNSPIKASHYLGFTRDGHLHERITRHYGGGGAELTRRWAEHRTDVRLAGTIPNGNLDLEKALKRGGHFKDFCPICLGLTQGVPWQHVTSPRWEYLLYCQGKSPKRIMPATKEWLPLHLPPLRSRKRRHL